MKNILFFCVLILFCNSNFAQYSDSLEISIKNKLLFFGDLESTDAVKKYDTLIHKTKELYTSSNTRYKNTLHIQFTNHSNKGMHVPILYKFTNPIYEYLGSKVDELIVPSGLNINILNKDLTVKPGRNVSVRPDLTVPMLEDCRDFHNNEDELAENNLFYIERNSTLSLFVTLTLPNISLFGECYRSGYFYYDLTPTQTYKLEIQFSVDEEYYKDNAYFYDTVIKDDEDVFFIGDIKSNRVTLEYGFKTEE